jgi:hypothetical protein
VGQHSASFSIPYEGTRTPLNSEQMGRDGPGLRPGVKQDACTVEHYAPCFVTEVLYDINMTCVSI